MGLRFRKSFKLAPGVRLNASGGGLSWTLGPRGASIGIGKRGTHLNAGLAGTGLSYQTRLDTLAARAPASPQNAQVDVQVNVSILDDGEVIFKDQAGNLVPDSWVKQAKLQQGDAIRTLIADKCAEINAQIDALGLIHLYTPAPGSDQKFMRQQYGESEPVAPVMKEYGVMAKVMKAARDRVDEENAELMVTYTAQKERWLAQKAAHDDEQTCLKQSFYAAMAGQPDEMERHLEAVLQEVVWPRETGISVAILGEGNEVYLDVDLPEIEDVPDKTAAVPASGFRLSIRTVSQTELRQRYAQHIHAIGFRLLGEIFAALPTVQKATISGYSQRPGRTTGQVSDEYLYSVVAERYKWCALNFNDLASLNLVEALSQFTLRRSMTKTGIFAPIEPFAPEG